MNMALCRAYRWIPIFVGLMLISLAAWGEAALRGSGAGTTTVFSQGQAALNAQDQTGSQLQAIQDFLVQAVVQALGTLLTPSQLGSQYSSVRDKILVQPQRYITDYEVFSEAPANGLYRVTGKVTVDLEVLRKDLETLERAEAQSSLSSPSSRESEETRDMEVDPREEASAEPRQETGNASRGVVSTHQDLFWVVTEKWDPEWVLPRDKRDPRGLFAMSMAQEAADYGWSLLFPRPGSIAMDQNGNVSPAQAISEAKTLGVHHVVVGTIALRQKQKQDPFLEMGLSVFNVSTGKPQGNIRKTFNVSQGSVQESAMEFANSIFPQLDSLLRQSGEADLIPPMIPKEQSQPRGPAGELKGTGEWTVAVARSENQFALMEELQNLIRERFKSAQIKSFELGAGEIRMRVDGVDGTFLSSLQGMKLSGGVQIQVDGASQETRTINLRFVSSKPSRPESRQ